VVVKVFASLWESIEAFLELDNEGHDVIANSIRTAKIYGLIRLEIRV
jgi:hypothetical protein